MTLRQFSERHPYVSTIVVELTLIAIWIAVNSALLPYGLPVLAPAIIGNIILVGITGVVLVRYGWWYEAGVTRWPRSDHRWLFIPAFLPIIVNLALIPLIGLAPLGAPVLLATLVASVLTGCMEEMFYRGLVLRIIMPQGARRAVAVSALWFSVTHVLNALAGNDLFLVVMQIGYAFGYGVMFGALVVRTGSLAPLIAAHALINLTSGLHATTVSTPLMQVLAGLTFCYLALFTIYGVMLMRGWPKQLAHR